MLNEKVRNIISCLFFLSLGLTCMIGAFQYGNFNSQIPNAFIFPFLSGFILSLLALSFLILSVIKDANGKKEPLFLTKNS